METNGVRSGNAFIGRGVMRLRPELSSRTAGSLTCIDHCRTGAASHGARAAFMRQSAGGPPGLVSTPGARDSSAAGVDRGAHVTSTRVEEVEEVVNLRVVKVLAEETISSQQARCNCVHVQRIDVR